MDPPPYSSAPNAIYSPCPWPLLPSSHPFPPPLSLQVIGGQVYGRSRGNGLYSEFYAGLLDHTLRHLQVPDVEFALHNGKDLPLLAKHEVRSRL